ncbi:MAG TPA: hypothetical protein VGP91_16550 [Actinoplanes sp.]|nr:hypothetical protein [Actinoplanes sp.]
MSEHGWPDHHDDPGYHDDHHDPLHEPADGLHDGEAPPLPDDDGYWDLHHHDDAGPAPDEPHDLVYEHHTGDPAEPAAEYDQHVDVADTHETATVGADPDALPEHVDTDAVFPPAVDVGPLPEPVDGFPWIDTGSLGVVDPAAPHALPVEDVSPHELADYAGTELPPGVDPWAALADSEDPATAALARWWSQHPQ